MNRSPHRTSWRRGALLVVLCTLGPLLAWRWRALESAAQQARAELTAALAETDAADPGWRWDDLEAARPGVSDARNSIRITAQIDALLRAGRLQEEHRSDARDFPDRQPANRLLSDAAHAWLDDYLPPRAEVIALARTLRDHPEGRATLQLRDHWLAIRLDHVQPCSEATRLLQVDAEDHLRHSRAHAAGENIHAMLHAGAALRGDGSTISATVRCTIRGVAVRTVERLLAQGDPDATTLAALQEHLTAEAAERPLRAGLRGERAAVQHTLEKLRAGHLSLVDLTDRTRRRSTWWSRGPVVPGYQLDLDHAAILRRLNAAVAIADLPVEQHPDQWRAFDADLRALLDRTSEDRRGFFPLLMLRSVSHVATAGQSDAALLRSVVVALAAERYRRAHQCWPERLVDLVPDYLPAVPLDPYTGQPLLAQRRGDGLAVYSVGPDGSDDGLPQTNPTQPERDIGVRLWDAPQRRLPPCEVAP